MESSYRLHIQILNNLTRQIILALKLSMFFLFFFFCHSKLYLSCAVHLCDLVMWIWNYDIFITHNRIRMNILSFIVRREKNCWNYIFMITHSKCYLFLFVLSLFAFVKIYCFFVYNTQCTCADVGNEKSFAIET